MSWVLQELSNNRLMQKQYTLPRMPAASFPVYYLCRFMKEGEG